MKIQYDTLVFPLHAGLPTSIMIPTVVPAFYKPGMTASAPIPLGNVVINHDIKNRSLHVSGLLDIIKANERVQKLNERSLLAFDIKFDDVGVMIKIKGFKLSKQKK